MLTRRLLVACIVAAALMGGLSGVAAQSQPATLVGRAVMPANTLTDGPSAGAALAKGATINGVQVPFDSQPVGSVSACLPGEYPGTWLILTDGRFDTARNSADFLLRIYTVDLNWQRATTGSGQVTPLDWKTLNDRNRRLTANLINANSRTRDLTGADFTPRAIQRDNNGAFWIADEKTPALIRVDGLGRVLEPAISLQEAGALQGMGILPDGSALVIAQKSTNNRRQVVFRLFDLTTRTLTNLPGFYTLERETFFLGGFTMLNTDEAVAIEQDGAQGSRADFKRVFLFNVRANPIGKTPIADLMQLDDPSGISTRGANPPDALGIGAVFTFPFSAITALAPIDEQTLLLANNNRIPFGLGRSATQADATEFIAVRLAQPLALDPAFLRPLR